MVSEKGFEIMLPVPGRCCFRSSWLFILLFILLSSPAVVAGWKPAFLPRLTSPSYSRRYAYWKNTANFPVAEEKVESNDATRSFTEVFQAFGVTPASQVPPFVWRWAYHLQIASLTLLHANDKLLLPNSSLSLPILWWKALLRDDSVSSWAFDILPGSSRWIVKFFKPLFPPLHHANIELRTAFLDTRTTALAENAHASGQRVRLVVLGAGYDLRALRFLNKGVVDEAVELDLESVVQAKSALLSSKRFQQRRPNCKLPQSFSADLNNMTSTDATLCQNLNSNNNRNDDGVSGKNNVYTIFLMEGILVHLERGSGPKILRLLRSFVSQKGHSSSGCLVFADWIEGVKDRKLDLAQIALKEAGWTLDEFAANPTKTPHFGVAFPNNAQS